MSNNLSTALLNQIFAQESDDPFVYLLTLSHPSITTLRFVNDNQDLTSRGNTYTAYPFTISLPPDDGDSARNVKLELDNTSLELIELIRSVTTAIDVTLELVLVSTPDVVQISLTDLKLRGLSYDKRVISGDLVMDSFLSIAMTSEKYTPLNFPGVF